MASRFAEEELRGRLSRKRSGYLSLPLRLNSFPRHASTGANLSHGPPPRACWPLGVLSNLDSHLSKAVFTATLLSKHSQHEQNSAGSGNEGRARGVMSCVLSCRVLW